MALSLMKLNLQVLQAQSNDVFLIQDYMNITAEPLILVSKLQLTKVKILKQQANYVI